MSGIKNIKLLLLLSFLLGGTAHAAKLDMLPGLWNMEIKMSVEGVEFDPLAEMKKHMGAIPKEQREALLKQMGASANIQTQQVCYSQKMIDNPEHMSQEQKECDFKMTSNTAKKAAATFTCKDGAKGDITWNLENSKSLKMVLNAVDKRGKKMQMNYLSKFIKADCGSLKPEV